MKHSTQRILLASLLVAGVGCSPAVRLPSLLPPGPAQFQRQNALLFDPYPLKDVGPEIEGGRPLSYNQPMSEVRQAQFLQPPPPRAFSF